MNPVEDQPKPVEISVVIPLFNEEESLQPLHEKLKQALDPLQREYELIFVDDGSTDSSFEILEKIHHKDPRVSVHQLRSNFGKSYGLQVGFLAASGRIIFTIDADLQDDPGEIPRFVKEIEHGYDLVSGWKKKRQDPLSKTLPSKIFNRMTSWASGLKIHDFNCGFKAYRARVAKSLNLYGDLYRFIPALVVLQGFRVGEIEVNHHPRQYGKSKYGTKRLVSGLFDFLTIFFLTRFRLRPMHFFGTFGLVLSLCGLSICSYLTVLWFMGNAIGHRPLLFLGILLLVVGAQFLSTGLLGEMLTRSQQRAEDTDKLVHRRLAHKD